VASKKALKKHKPTLGALIILVVVLGAASYIYIQYRRTQQELNQIKTDPKVLAVHDKYRLIDNVSKLVDIPLGEEPKVATITNVHRLKGQAFFARAENEDKVLIFPKAGRAILYRPSTNKIIEAAPVNINDLQETVQDNSTEIAKEKTNQITDNGTAPAADIETEENVDTEIEQQVITLALYNGTRNIAGLAKESAAFISENINDISFEVVAKDDAEETYTETIIIDFEDTHPQAVEALIELFAGKAAELPVEEVQPDADILIILGTTFADSHLDELDLEVLE